MFIQKRNFRVEEAVGKFLNVLRKYFFSVKILIENIDRIRGGSV